MVDHFAIYHFAISIFRRRKPHHCSCVQSGLVSLAAGEKRHTASAHTPSPGQWPLPAGSPCAAATAPKLVYAGCGDRETPALGALGWIRRRRHRWDTTRSYSWAFVIAGAFADFGSGPTIDVPVEYVECDTEGVALELDGSMAGIEGALGTGWNECPLDGMLEFVPGAGRSCRSRGVQACMGPCREPQVGLCVHVHLRTLILCLPAL